MQLYKSDYFSIEKQDEILIQKWSNIPLGVDDYQKELLTFLNYYNQEKPKSLVWDNDNCTLEIPEELDNWMGSEILIPVFKKGLKKIILTVPQNTSVHLSIVSSLEKAKSILQSVYFTDVNEAKKFAIDDVLIEEKKPLINVNLNDDHASFNLNVTVSPSDLGAAISSINKIHVDNEFIKLNYKKYESLTLQEITIFKLIALGNTNKQIAQILFIEESSVKTHRKHIKYKLEIQSIFDIYRYAQCFGILK